MAGHLDRALAGRLLQRIGADALILLSPEAFRHATGAAPGVATMWRRAGAVAVLVPADPGLAPAAVASDLFAPAFRRTSPIADLRSTPIWVEATEAPDLDPDADAAPQLASHWHAEGRSPGRHRRPETFTPLATWHHLRDALAERGLAGGRIAVEMAAISADDWPAMVAALAPAQLLDGGSVARWLRAIKSPAEVALLRRAAGLAEAGFAAARVAVAPGITPAALSAVWRGAVQDAAGAVPLTGLWDFISVGPDPWGAGRPARPGDVIRVDAGCLVEGYTSDTARTWTLGPPGRAAGQIHAALLAGFEAGLARLTPGTPLAEVHAATTAAIRDLGFEGYARGHFGHSLGTGPGSEEWPFISADSPAAVTPGMVLAFECPWYITGLGGFIIEDQIEITADGPVPMTRLPRDLASL